MEKYYSVRAPIHLDHSNGLKANIPVKRLFELLGDNCRDFRNMAMEGGINGRFSYCLEETVVGELIKNGWDVVDQEEPTCKCGYCEYCMKIDRERLKSSVSVAEFNLIQEIEDLERKKWVIYNNLTEEGQNYIDKKISIYPAAEVGWA